MEREVLSNSFLEKQDIHSRIPKEVPKLVLAASAPKTLNIPDERSHLETRGEPVLSELEFSAKAWEPELMKRSWVFFLQHASF
jgi:hypothetical protein